MLERDGAQEAVRNDHRHQRHVGENAREHLPHAAHEGHALAALLLLVLVRQRKLGRHRQPLGWSGAPR